MTHCRVCAGLRCCRRSTAEGALHACELAQPSTPGCPHQFYEAWGTNPLRGLDNSFANAHFSFVHRSLARAASLPGPQDWRLVGSAVASVVDPLFGNPPRGYYRE